MSIELDPVETQIKSILLDFCDKYAQTGPQLTLRFTGGWVRDKLLNRACHDIDVAIDQTTGEEFATKLHEHLSSQGMSEIGVHKIASNPEKSKHLETATTRICGLDVDFVNLRSEEYAEDSRVPTEIKFGTPEQDALRRDCTLNALFYNLQTSQIEDFTKRGLEDLEKGVLRTPLEPVQTFHDDPLRVLRLLRFAAQLNFTIEKDTFEAMRGSQIGDLLVKKVSTERVGIELLKLIEADYAFKGMQFLSDLGLGEYVFNSKVVDLSSKIECMRTIRLPKFDQSVLWLTIILQDLSYEDVKKKDDSEVCVILKDRLKTTKVVKEAVITVLKSSELYDELEPNRPSLGKFVRQCGQLYPLCILFNTLKNQAEDVYSTQIADMGLTEAYNLKPLLSGKQLMTLLDRKPGPWMTEALSMSIDAQLENPSITVDEMTEIYKSKFLN